MEKFNLVNRDDFLVNARIKYIPDDNGVYQPYEMTVFDRSVYVTADLERVKGKKYADWSDFELDKVPEPDSVPDEAENRRKSFCRAKNNLFDLLMCTPSFDSFVTLTVSADKADRHDYTEIVKKLGIWLDNRVRRNGLKYVLVPERHKDGAVHFHGLLNKDCLKLVRAASPYTGEALSDNHNRPIYNIKDFPLGFTTVIPLSGENARIATAKYCYKYITKSGGEKVGGRYYLSGGDLGRPRYSFDDVDYMSVGGKEINIPQANLKLKKIKL